MRLILFVLAAGLGGCATPQHHFDCVGKVVIENDTDQYNPGQAFLPCQRLCIREDGALFAVKVESEGCK